MARSNNLVTDPYPESRPRLSWIIPFADGDGSKTSGVAPISRNVNNFLAHGEAGYYDRSIPISGGAGTFTITGETITESVSGATGTYLWDDGTTMYLRLIAGTFGGGGRTLTGGTSGATRVAGTVQINLSPTSSASSLDNVLSVSRNKRALLLYPWGQYASSALNCPGHYPFDFITAGSQGAHLNVLPRNQVQSESAFGSTVYTAALKAGLDTAGRLGALWTLDVYVGPVEGTAATDTTTLDTYSEFDRYLGLSGRLIDVQSVLSNSNTAPPAILGSNVLAWFEANRSAYSDAGSTAAVEAGPVQQWSSLVGSAVWSSAGTARPTYKTNILNGYPVLRFDGVNDKMTLGSALAPGAAHTILMVVKPTATDACLLSHSSINESYMRLNEVAGGCISAYEGGSATLNRSVASSFTAGTWYILRGRYDGTNLRWYVNGTQVGSYAAGPAFHSGTSIDTLGSYGFIAAKFFDSDIAALAICDASATDNQVQLIEAYWASKYGLTIAGSPSLPHKAFVERLYATYGLKTYRENFNDRISPSLTAWDTNSAGIAGLYSELASAVSDTPNIYTKTSIGSGQRARVMILNTGGASVATRITYMQIAVALGYDVDMDPGGFTAVDIANADIAYESAIDGGGWRSRSRLSRNR